jgi:hypothetical protein
MAFSLYAATIPSYQQILGSVSGLLVKAEAFCVEKSINGALARCDRRGPAWDFLA